MTTWDTLTAEQICRILETPFDSWLDGFGHPIPDRKKIIEHFETLRKTMTWEEASLRARTDWFKQNIHRLAIKDMTGPLP